MATLEAPRVTKDRAHARDFLSDLPSDLSTTPVEIRFADRSIATTSFVDELIRELFVERKAISVTLLNLNGSGCSVANAAAADFDVADRLVCT